MEDLWTTDSRVLNAVVQHIEVEGRGRPNMTDLYASLELDEARGARSVERLVDAGMLRDQATFGGAWFVTGVTERGLRESGAWPTADQLAERVVSALDEAAEREPEPDKRSKLRGLATGLGGAGRDVLVDVMAAVAVKSAGLG